MRDDPGGVFASDAHRRVMANLPNPDQDALTVEDLLAQRIAKDDHLVVVADPGTDQVEVEVPAGAVLMSVDELAGVLAELAADGHAVETDAGWQNTESGFVALTNPAEAPDA